MSRSVFWIHPERLLLLSNPVCQSVFFIGVLRPLMLRDINENCLLIPVVLSLWCGCSSLVQHLCSLLVRASIEKLGVILMGLPLYVTLSFTFQLSKAFCNVVLQVQGLIIMRTRECLYQSSPFGVLNFLLLLDRHLLLLARENSIICMKILSVSLKRVSSPSSIPVICRFGLFMVSQLYWMFLAWIFKV